KLVGEGELRAVVRGFEGRRRNDAGRGSCLRVAACGVLEYESGFPPPFLSESSSLLPPLKKTKIAGDLGIRVGKCIARETSVSRAPDEGVHRGMGAVRAKAFNREGRKDYAKNAKKVIGSSWRRSRTL